MDDARLEERLAHWSPRVSRAVAYSQCIAVAGSFLYQIGKGGQAFLGLFEDDFFYYAVIADKLAALGKLTFDGITLTNGFHPLWFGVIFALRSLCGSLGPAFFTVLVLVMLASMIVTYELFRVLSRALGASDAIAAPIAVFQCIATCKLLASGMEVVIAVPLFTWLLIEVARGTEVTVRRAARLGLLSSLVILARLDLAIGVAMILAGWLALARPRAGDAVRALAAFGAAGLAFPAYALWNLVAFGAFLPISALAKQIQTTRGFNLWFWSEAATITPYGMKVDILIPLGVIALVALVKRDRAEAARRPDRAAARFAAGVALLFPIVYYSVNAIQSAWSFFSWYAYPLGIALVAATTLIWEAWGPLVIERMSRATRARAAAVGLALLAVYVPVLSVRHFVFNGIRWSLADNSLTAMSVELSESMRDRQGTFAMGDKAGVATYLLGKPVIQLEGLVCDRDLLTRIRAQESLDRALDAYHVDYLIVSLGRTRLDTRGGCYLVEHPHPDQAGERSAKMRAKVCGEPIAHFETPHGPHAWSRYVSLETFVFDVRGDKRRNVTAPEL
jgi:hypothetical protein